jgi:predicted TPR repeat methyltransferase
MQRAAELLAPRGVLAFSVETTEAGEYLVLPSGRFAHSRNYVERIARGRFDIERAVGTRIRLDVRGAAEGMIFLLRRASS